MTFYYNDSWLAFLSEAFVRESMSLCMKECSGCKDDMKSAILHLHHQMSLLDKLKLYFEKVRGEMLAKIPMFYLKFEKKLPHSEDLSKDRNIYCEVARSFLMTCTAETLYYGRYITELTDSLLQRLIKPMTKRLRKERSHDIYRV